MKRHILAILIGFLLAIAISFLGSGLPGNLIHDFLALLLAANAGIYLGTAIREQKNKLIIIESVLFIILIFLAFAGLYFSLMLTGTGFLIHALWSLLHYLTTIGGLHRYPFSAGYVTLDLVLAIFCFGVLI